MNSWRSEHVQVGLVRVGYGNRLLGGDVGWAFFLVDVNGNILLTRVGPRGGVANTAMTVDQAIDLRKQLDAAIEVATNTRERAQDELARGSVALQPRGPLYVRVREVGHAD